MGKSDVEGDKHVNFDSKAELCETHFCKINSCLEGLGGSGLHAEFGGGSGSSALATSASAGELVATAAVLLPFLFEGITAAVVI